jgi:hypothetical protein
MQPRVFSRVKEQELFRSEEPAHSERREFRLLLIRKCLRVLRAVIRRLDDLLEHDLQIGPAVFEVVRDLAELRVDRQVRIGLPIFGRWTFALGAGGPADAVGKPRRCSGGLSI